LILKESSEALAAFARALVNLPMNKRMLIINDMKAGYTKESLLELLIKINELEIVETRKALKALLAEAPPKE